MAVGDAHVFPGFLNSTNITFFPKPLTTFLTCVSRGERQNTPERSSPQPGLELIHQVMSQTRLQKHPAGTLSLEPLHTCTCRQEGLSTLKG